MVLFRTFVEKGTNKIGMSSKIICLVRDDSSAKKAKKYGATHVVNTGSSNVEEEIIKITGGNKADVVIDATGAKSVIESLPYYVKKGGNIILYGIPADNEVINFPVKKLVVEEISVHGTVGNTKAWYPLVKMIESESLDVESLVTHEFSLDDINKAFDLYRNKDKTLIKAIIKF